MSPVKVFIISVLAVLIIAVPVGAKPENIVMGLYKVSFDMGIDNLKWDIKETPSETLSGSTYITYTATANPISPLVMIKIDEFNFNGKESAPTESVDDIQGIKKNVESFLTTLGYTNIDVRGRTIDGHSAAIGYGQHADIDLKLYNAAWWMDNTSVDIASSYPWNEGTLALVKTIHVEKA